MVLMYWRKMNQYMTENELNVLKGLLHYLNTSMGKPAECQIGVDIAVIDSNGERLCNIEYNDGPGYVLELAHAN